MRTDGALIPTRGGLFCVQRSSLACWSQAIERQRLRDVHTSWNMRLEKLGVLARRVCKACHENDPVPRDCPYFLEQVLNESRER